MVLRTHIIRTLYERGDTSKAISINTEQPNAHLNINIFGFALAKRNCYQAHVENWRRIPDELSVSNP